MAKYSVKKCSSQELWQQSNRFMQKSFEIPNKVQLSHVAVIVKKLQLQTYSS